MADNSPDERDRWPPAHYQRLVRCRDFENRVPWLALIDAMRADANGPDPVTEPCPCYRCSDPIHDYHNRERYVVNNVHGELRPCEECGRAKSEYTDHGTWGGYQCWWCTERAADSRMLPEAHPA